VQKARGFPRRDVGQKSRFWWRCTRNEGKDPARLLQGTGKFMRHVKLRPGTATDAAVLSQLIAAAYSDIKARVENG